MDDAEVLAKTIYGEARGEPEEGQYAVGATVINRLSMHTWYGDTVTGVCLKPYQYSCWLRSDPNYQKLIVMDDSDPLLRPFINIAEEIINGANDPTKGATHYYAVSIPPPAWIANATFTVQIGHHRFYKDVP